VNASMIETSKICDYPAASHISNTILSNGKIVNMVSADYGFISNQDFFGKFEQKLREERIQFEAKYTNYDDARFTADYILDGELFIKPEHKGKYGIVDSIKPKLRLTNSYDGKVPLAGYFGFFRQICSNGLHAQVNDLAFQKRRTRSNIEIIFPTMSEMIEQYKKNDQVKIFRKYEVLAEKTIKKSELENIVKHFITSENLFKFEKSDKNPEPSIQSQFVLDTIAKECDTLHVKPNAWIVYNSINEWIYSDERNKKDDGMRRNLDLKVFNKFEKMYL
jgi:DNA-binding Xre family transcriptional regulator